MKKIISFLIVMTFIMSITSCGQNSERASSNTNLSALTPQQLLDTAFSALKTADTTTFNDCVVYPDEKHYNVYFGDNLEDDDGYIAALFEHLSYEINTIETQEDTAVVTCRISNKDFSKLDMNQYSETENPLVSAIKNCDADILSQEINVDLKKIDNQWKIMIDDNFTDAISGGSWSRDWLEFVTFPFVPEP